MGFVCLRYFRIVKEKMDMRSQNSWNQLIRNSKSSWKTAFQHSKSLPLQMQPENFILLSKGQLTLDKRCYGAPKFSKSNPTLFTAQIHSKGYRRIYRGYKVIGYMQLDQSRWVRGGLEACERYYFVEIDRKEVVVLFDFEVPLCLDDLVL